MKSTYESEITDTASSTDTTSSAVLAPGTSSGEFETASKGYQAKVLGITIFGVVGIVVFIKYVVTKYFAELEANHSQHSEF